MVLWSRRCTVVTVLLIVLLGDIGSCMVWDIDMVQMFACMSGTFIAHITSASVMLYCARPRPERKHGLFKLSCLPCRLFRLGTQDLWVCVCMRVTMCYWLFSIAVFRKDLPGGPLVTRNKILQILGSWLCVWSALFFFFFVMWSWLTLTWRHPLLSSPPFLPSGDVSVWWREGRLPHTCFQFRGGSHFLALKFSISRRGFLQQVILL